jgi:hypothetical protein
VSGRLVDIPDNPELVAELEVFKPNFDFEETPDYALQVAQQSAMLALCLVTHDLDPSMWEFHPSIYCNFDPDLIDPPMGGYWRLF